MPKSQRRLVHLVSRTDRHPRTAIRCGISTDFLLRILYALGDADQTNRGLYNGEIGRMSAPTLNQVFVGAARETLAEGLAKIEHCVAQLSDDQLWWRPRPEMNSIANLMLHLSGNVRQWIIAGVGGAKDARNRPGEFADRSNRSREQFLGVLKSTVDDALAAIARQTADDLVSPRRIQGFDITVTDAIFPPAPLTSAATCRKSFT